MLTAGSWSRHDRNSFCAADQELLELSVGCEDDRGLDSLGARRISQEAKDPFGGQALAKAAGLPRTTAITARPVALAAP